MADDITESKEFQTVSTKLFALGVRDPEELYQMTLDVMGTPQDDSSRFGEAAKEFMSIKSDIEEQQRKSKALESEQRLSWFPEEQAAAEQLKERGKELAEQMSAPRGDPLQHAEEQLSESLGEDVSALSRRKKRKMLKDPESYMKKKQKQKQEPAPEKE